MYRALSLAVVAILAACALAAPTPIKELSKRNTFRVDVTRRTGLSPLKEMARAFEKFGWEIIVVPADALDGLLGSSASSSAAPVSASATAAATTMGSDATSVSATAAAASATSTASSGETGEVAADPESNDSEYLESVSIGGQKLNLDFDTGSADLWVFSSSMPSSESSGHSLFNPSESSSWSEYEGGTWEISYGDGSTASGTVGFDTVNIGGATATKQAVEIATSVSGSFEEDTDNDGLVGLGFSSINTVKPEAQKTFFANVMDSLAQPLFTANLKDGTSGSYTFGEIDSSEYTGEIHYADVDNSNGFWQFSTTTYSVSGSSSSCETCSPAIADTGTSLMLLDTDMVDAFYYQVDGASYDSSQGGYVYDCTASLPSFGFTVGDYTATIQGSDLTYAEVGDGTCFGGIQSNEGEGLIILGDVFLKNFLAVFDGGNTRFGIAEQS